MKNKFLSIILLFAFGSVVLQPLIPFVQYFLVKQNIISIDKDDCCCENQTKKSAAELMQNNGSNYLNALIKRTCKDQKKRKPAVPTGQTLVFVKKLFSEQAQAFTCPKKNFNKISTFIIQPDLKSFIADIFHPPALI